MTTVATPVRIEIQRVPTRRTNIAQQSWIMVKRNMIHTKRMPEMAIGWRIRGGVLDAALAFALVLVFGFGMIWFGILIGSLLRTVEAVNGVMFTALFPMTFLANTFVPTEPMPHWLRVIAEWNPMSSLARAMRELWGNGGPAPESAQLPLHHPVLATILWSLALTAIFAPFALRA